jgi:hypothetical protein
MWLSPRDDRIVVENAELRYVPEPVTTTSSSCADRS